MEKVTHHQLLYNVRQERTLLALTRLYVRNFISLSPEVFFEYE